MSPNLLLCYHSWGTVKQALWLSRGLQRDDTRRRRAQSGVHPPDRLLDIGPVLFRGRCLARNESWTAGGRQRPVVPPNVRSADLRCIILSKPARDPDAKAATKALAAGAVTISMLQRATCLTSTIRPFMGTMSIADRSITLADLD
jgi:hypothetical protein